jgi:large subunit ribosomal protein L24
LNTEDKWRIAKLEGKDPRKQPKTEKVKTETKTENVKEAPKETKGAEKTKKEEDDN